MKKINDFTSSYVVNNIKKFKTDFEKTKNRKQFVEATISDEAIDLVNELFQFFKVHVSGFNFYAKDIAELEFFKNEWVICFQRASVEKEEVLTAANKIRDLGLKKLLTPSEFIELCRPKKSIRPQRDTVNTAYMFIKGVESDAHKEKKKIIALSHLKQMKNKLEK